jgi:hypothetical protein
MDRAKEVCVIGDGAPWIWNIADEQFYGAYWSTLPKKETAA